MDQRIDIGIDGGGTGCRVVVALEAREAWATGGPANALTDPAGAEAAIRGALMQAMAALGLHWDDLGSARIVAGMAGCRLPETADAFAMRLPYLAYVVEDSVTALEGAFGGAEGTLVNLGTGSFFIRRDGRGITHHGGWGFHLGDDLSAAWLGREALRDWVRIEDGSLRAMNDDPLSAALHKACGKHPVLFAQDARPQDYAALAPIVMAHDTPFARSLQRNLIAALEVELSLLEHPVGTPWVLTGGLGEALAGILDADMAAGLRASSGSALDGALSMARGLP